MNKELEAMEQLQSAFIAWQDSQDCEMPEWLSTLPSVTLYRGTKQPYSKHWRKDNGCLVDSYECWTTNPDVAIFYAGPDGYISMLSVSGDSIKEDTMDANADRNLVFHSRNHCGCGIPGMEICVYPGHDEYTELDITCIPVHQFR